VGNPIKLYGLNSVGLQRNGFSDEVVRELKRAYRLFFRSDMNLSQAMAAAETELHMYPEVAELMRFVEASGRGVVI
jgi:UDP-N-acetylglucosamine acyltransferase